MSRGRLVQSTKLSFQLKDFQEKYEFVRLALANIVTYFLLLIVILLGVTIYKNRKMKTME